MIRLVLRSLHILIAILVSVPLHYSTRLIGMRSKWPPRFLRWVGFAAGARVTVVGTPRTRHVLFLANHVSWLDIMIIAGASGAAFVAKSEIRKWPGIGWLCGLNNTVFIERAERGNVRGQADAMRDALLAGQPLGLFPEGTTDGGAEVLPFRAALVSSVFPPLPGVVVQPVAIDYGAAVGDIAWVGEEPAAANMKRVLSRRGTIPVTLHFLEEIDPAACADRKVLAQRARDEIVAALARG